MQQRGSRARSEWRLHTFKLAVLSSSHVRRRSDRRWIRRRASELCGQLWAVVSNRSSAAVHDTALHTRSPYKGSTSIQHTLFSTRHASAGDLCPFRSRSLQSAPSLMAPFHGDVPRVTSHASFYCARLYPTPPVAVSTIHVPGGAFLSPPPRACVTSPCACRDACRTRCAVECAGRSHSVH